MLLNLVPWDEAVNLILFSFSMVFLLLLVIVLVLTLFGKIVTYSERKLQKKASVSAESVLKEFKVPESGTSDESGEICAAISMTLYQLRKSPHDTESNILTITPKGKRYSPWNSKIYGLNAWYRK